jgi:hypothetical protein
MSSVENHPGSFVLTALRLALEWLSWNVSCQGDQGDHRSNPCANEP